LSDSALRASQQQLLVAKRKQRLECLDRQSRETERHIFLLSHFAPPQTPVSAALLAGLAPFAAVPLTFAEATRTSHPVSETHAAAFERIVVGAFELLEHELRVFPPAIDSVKTS
jgi:hypothetical protein